MREKRENLAAPARSTNDERTNASLKNTVFLPKNNSSQLTKPSANRRENFAEEIRTKTTPTVTDILCSNPRTRRSETPQTKNKRKER
jgi:hypothetical protein